MKRDPEDIRTMSVDEMRPILISLHNPTRIGRLTPNRLTVKDVWRECCPNRAPWLLYAIVRHGTLSKELRTSDLKRLSRFLALVRSGMVRKINGKVTYLEAPDETYVPPNPPVIHRVVFDPFRGVPRLVIGAAPPPVRSVETFFGKMLRLGK